MISSGVLYVVGDITAQIGIEDKTFFASKLRDDDVEGKYDVSPEKRAEEETKAETVRSHARCG